MSIQIMWHDRAYNLIVFIEDEGYLAVNTIDNTRKHFPKGQTSLQDAKNWLKNQ